MEWEAEGIGPYWMLKFQLVHLLISSTNAGQAEEKFEYCQLPMCNINIAMLFTVFKMNYSLYS